VEGVLLFLLAFLLLDEIHDQIRESFNDMGRTIIGMPSNTSSVFG